MGTTHNTYLFWEIIVKICFAIVILFLPIGFILAAIGIAVCVLTGGAWF